MRIAVAADHNGVALKRRLIGWLEERGHLVADLGAQEDTGVVDYPPLCAAVGRRVTDGSADMGLVVGGSGQGEVIACNKIRGIRAGVCHTRFMVEISRGNNDANVLVIGAKVVSGDEAEELLALWLATPFKGGVHQARLDQIAALEQLP